MSADNIKTICAVAPGTMGGGTALCFAMTGHDVFLYGRKESSLENGRANINKALNDYITHGLLDEAKVPEIWSRLFLTTDMAQAARKADMVVESIDEDMTAKQETFRQLDQLCPRHTVFGTNTSSLDINAIASVLSPDRRPYFLGTHLFNPPHLMSLAEVVATQDTAQETMDVAYATMVKIGKEPVRLEKTIDGYIVNRVQGAMWHAAYDLHHQGYQRDDIDSAITATLGRGFSVLKALTIKDVHLLSGKQIHIAHSIHGSMRKAAGEIVDRGIASPSDVERAVYLTLGLRLQETGPLMSADLTGLDIVMKIKNSLGLSVTPFLQKAVDEKRVGPKVYNGHPSREGIYFWERDMEARIRGSRTTTFINYHKSRIAAVASTPQRPGHAAQTPVSDYVPAK